MMKNPPYSIKYDPVRFAMARPFLPTLLQTYRRLAGPPGPCLQFAALQAISYQVSAIYNELIFQLPREQRPKGGSAIFELIESVMLHALFVANGRAIFDFSPALIDLFRFTDVDEVPFSSIRTPYPVLYLWFGPQADLDVFGDGGLCDGAYVTHLEGKFLRVVLSVARHDVGYGERRNVIAMPDRYYSFPMEPETPDIPLGKMIEGALENELRTHRNMPDHSGVYQVGGIDVPVQSVAQESSEQRAQELLRGHRVFHEAVKLIINGLCFLTAYPEDRESRRPEDTPPELLNDAERGKTEKIRRRARVRLDREGYSPIWFCGEKVTRELSLPAGRTVSQHWRRGHWHHYRHGPGRSQIKLLWTKPMLIHRDRGDSPPGHIYMVDEGHAREGAGMQAPDE